MRHNMKKFSLCLLLLSFIFFVISTESTSASSTGYDEYRTRFESVSYLTDIENAGYEISGGTYITEYFMAAGINAECTVYPAINKQYGRAALFFADEGGAVLYKTEDLECNNFYTGSLIQPNIDIAATAGRDINGNGLLDILIVSRCSDDGDIFKIGDILFQSEDIFYRDWRVSDKINRFSMNKDLNMITAFARNGQSVEFLYSASTLEELINGGFEPLPYQIFDANYEKFGAVKVVPGIYTMGEHSVFILYLVDDAGQVVWNFQCARHYDNFSRMTGISFKDVDGDGWADLSVMARYMSLDDNNKTYSATDFSIYYQRNGYFFEDEDFRAGYFKSLTGKEKMDDIVQAARRYWGW